MNKIFNIKNYLSFLYQDKFNKIYLTNLQKTINIYRILLFDADENLYLLNSTLFRRLFSQDMMSVKISLIFLS